MRYCFTIILLFNAYLTFSVNYITITSGNFTDNIWSPKNPASPIIYGDTLFINHSLNLNLHVRLYGVIIVSGTGALKGTIKNLEITSTGMLLNNGTFRSFEINNYGTIISYDSLISNNLYNTAGNIFNYGGMFISGEFNNQSGYLHFNNCTEVGQVFKNNSGAINDNQYFRVSGLIDNDSGFIINNGVMISEDDFSNVSGELENNGYVGVNNNFNNTHGLIKGVFGDFDVDNQFNNTNGTIDGTLYMDVCSSNGFTYNLVGNGYINWSTVTFCGTILPIQLVYFKVKAESRQIYISWEAASEVNTDYFTIERSADGENFISLGNIQAAGNSLTTTNYACSDDKPLPGISYYRLKQTDHRGNFGYFPIVTVDYNSGLVSELTLYPNPSEGEFFNIAVSYLKDPSVEMKITDEAGKLIYSAVLANKQGNIFTVIKPDTKLASGVYLVSLKGKTQSFEKKLVVK